MNEMSDNVRMQAGDLPFMLDYESLPVFSPADILPKSGFVHGSLEQGRKAEEFFYSCLSEAIARPDWVAIAVDTPEYDERVKSNLPRPQWMTSGDWRIFSSIPPENFAVALKQIRSLTFPGVYSPAQEDLGIRVYQIMAEHYPHLSMFRGAEYDPKIGFNGFDFTDGNLRDVLENYTERGRGGHRKQPVIVSLKFADAVAAYSTEKITIRFAGDLWGNHVEINTNYGSNFRLDSLQSICTLRRAPNNKGEMDALLQQNDKVGIQL